MNIHSLHDSFRNVKIKELQDIKERKHLESNFFQQYTIVLQANNRKAELFEKQNQENDNVLMLDFDMLLLGINSRGNLDPYVVSYICHQLNTKHTLGLFPIIFLSNRQNAALYTENFGLESLSILNQQKRFVFNKQKYENYIKFLNFQSVKTNIDEKLIYGFIHQLENDLSLSLIDFNTKNLHYLEKLFIGMLGHNITQIRESSVRFLNVLYDQVDWQLSNTFTTSIQSITERFKINYLIEADPEDNTVYVQLSATSFCSTSNQQVITWHKPILKEYKSPNQQQSNKYCQVSLDLGEFTKCGFYDWKLVRFEKNGKIKGVDKVYDLKELKLRGLQTLEHLILDSEKCQMRNVQSRIIVHPSYATDLQVHEVFVDFQKQIINAQHDHQQDYNQDHSVRGTFQDVQKHLEKYKSYGINCIYLMGALERDNVPYRDQRSQQIDFKRKDASPLAITCRQTPCMMLGGKQGFKDLVKESLKRNIKIIIDCLTRVSSSRAHKRYLKHLVYRLDEDGKKNICYGTDGRSLNFEDTAILNYRKKKVWDLLVEEVIQFVKEYNINGIHLDNGQSWPQIMKIDYEEIYRIDTDGTPAYNNKQIFQGDVVIPDEYCGYHCTEACLEYPNPLMVKLSKSLWRQFPDFLIISETFASQSFDNIEVSTIKSGPIPRMFTIPRALSSIFGQKLNKDGSVVPCERANVNVFRLWYENRHKLYPKGSIVIQSTTSHIWPNPALLYKNGVQPAIDIFYFLLDIPMTFIGEHEGQAYRSKSTNIFTRITIKPNQSQIDMQNSSIKINNQQKQMDRNQKLAIRAKSTLHLQVINQEKQMFQEQDEEDLFQHLQEQTELRQSGGSLHHKEHTHFTPLRDHKLSLSSYNLSNQYNSSTRKSVQLNSNSSSTQLNQYFQQSDNKNLINAESQFRQEMKQKSNFDLKQISKHYEHRSHLRHKKVVFRKGKLIPLNAETDFGWHSQVLVFARHYQNEIAIVAINFNEFKTDMYLNLKNLSILFDNIEENINLIAKVEDWFDNNKDHYYFSIPELLNDRHQVHLGQYQTMVWGVTILSVEDNKQLQKSCLQSSISRLKKSIKLKKPVYSNIVPQMLIKILKNTAKVQTFINGYAFLAEKELLPSDINLIELIDASQEICHDNSVICKLLAFFKAICLIDDQYHIIKNIKCLQIAKDIWAQNDIGPIAFATPQIGRWTSVGGIGIMIDELTQGLANLNEQVYIVSPYYFKTRNETQNYLEPDIFKESFQFQVKCGHQNYEIKVFEGTVNKIKLYFLQQPEIFPYPYPELGSEFSIRQIALYGKAVLELFCQIKIIPSLFVTNDWFSGLISAYGKSKQHFGDIFNGSKFLHIVHNLEEQYEGKRIYLNREEGTLEHLHGLNNELLLDPSEQGKTVLNPSRCAILTSDQWATVSPTYKNTLLSQSPLSPILNKMQKPFAFANGIQKYERLTRLKQLCNLDHFEGKKLLQQKYFGFEDLDNTKLVMSFIGRITKQKGVNLILESFPQIHKKFNGKVQLIIGGKADNDKYGNYCVGMIEKYKKEYPKNFWAQYDQFFVDGDLLNIGSDFGMMPSKFEPGGIVQHEFFVASTPVIAFKTGGLQDSIVDFNINTKKGNGIFFQEHTWQDFMFAVERGIQIYMKPQLYNILRSNAFESVIDVADVSRAWDKEFRRLLGKVFVDWELMNNYFSKLDLSFDHNKYKTQYPTSKYKCKIITEEDELIKNFERVLIAHKRANLKQHTFRYKTSQLPRPKKVQINGSFDGWQKPLDLNYDYFNQIWTINLHLQPGQYFYKFLVDEQLVCNDDDQKDIDIHGNINNSLILQ